MIDDCVVCRFSIIGTVGCELSDRTANLVEEWRNLRDIERRRSSNFGGKTSLKVKWRLSPARQLSAVTDMTMSSSRSTGTAAISSTERMPVPGSMWQPWRSWLGQSGGASAYFFANPVVGIGPVRLTPLICDEQLIVWPVLQSMLSDPEMIIAVGNGWWTADTNIVAIQRASASASAWARLFSKPLILSFNT